MYEVISHVTTRFPIVHFLWWFFGTKPLPLTVSEMAYVTMVDMTLNDLYAKVKVIGFGTNRFLIIRLL